MLVRMYVYAIICICTYMYIHSYVYLNAFLHHIATSSSIVPVPTGGPSGKILMCIVICNVHPYTYICTYVHTYIRMYIMLGFQ